MPKLFGPNISTAGAKNKHQCAPVRVHRPKISTAGAKNSTSVLTALTTFRISDHKKVLPGAREQLKKVNFKVNILDLDLDLGIT